MTIDRTLAVGIATALAWGALGASPGKAPDVTRAQVDQEWVRATSPNEHHASLRRYVGQWEATIRIWGAPGAPPIVSTGTAEYRLVLGERYLMQTLDGALLGEPFHGIGLRGYDNVLGKHTSMWIDDKGTSMLVSEGECGDGHDRETHRATVRSPFGGADQWIRIITRVLDENRHVIDFYATDPDGREFHSMEVTYDRR